VIQNIRRLQQHNKSFSMSSMDTKIRVGEQAADRTMQHAGLKINRWTIHPLIIRHLLTISLAIQLVSMFLVYLVDSAYSQSADISADTGLFVMIICQVLHLALVVLVSVTLTTQVIDRTVTISFLVSSYLSTVILFAGIYGLIYRITESSFTGLEAWNGGDAGANVARIFAKLLYFSITTMTTVGMGDIHPNAWYACVVVALQALMSVTYTTVIFARGMSMFMDDKRGDKPVSKQEENEQKIVLSIVEAEDRSANVPLLFQSGNQLQQQRAKYT
jgi:hypothetical protein